MSDCSSSAAGCHICTLLVELGVRYADDDDAYHAAVDRLFDQADRAQHARRVKRRRRWRKL